MVTVEPSFQAEDSPVDRRHPAMCVAVALNPFHTCPALPPSHRIPSRWPPGEEEVDKKCCHSSRPNPSQRCSGGDATGFRAGMHRRAERKDEEERSARAAASNGALAPEPPFGRTAARERGGRICTSRCAAAGRRPRARAQVSPPSRCFLLQGNLVSNPQIEIRLNSSK